MAKKSTNNLKLKVKSKTETASGSATSGRKRDPDLDREILNATLEILASVGFDTMTMDMVAAHIKTSKTTIYRRWISKSELVRDALIRMSEDSMNSDVLNVPEASLKERMLSVLKPFSREHSERKIKVLAGLGSFLSQSKEIAQETLSAIFEPWITLNRKLMKEAAKKGEISQHADIDAACTAIIALNLYRVSYEGKQFDKAYYAAMLDSLIIPALKHPPV